MPKFPIPDDWNGEEWSCVKISWPNSDQWMGLLQGLLTNISRGRFWDEETGTITEAQQVAFQVMDRNFPFRPCDGGDIPDPCIPDSDIVSIIESITCEIGEDDMGCSIPHGAIKYIDGVLSYRYCNEWYPVEGQTQYPVQPGPIQPGDPDAPELPDGTADATSCSKTAVLSDVLFGIVDELLDAAEVPEAPTAALVRVQGRYPFISFGQGELFSAYLDAVTIVAQGLANETEDPDVQQTIRCRMVDVISDGNQGLSDDEREDVQSAIVSGTSAYFSLWTYPTAFGSMNNIYLRSYRAIGPNDTKAITSYATPTGLENCACPDAPVPPPEDGDATEPDVNGFYLSRNMVEDFGVYSQQSDANAAFWLYGLRGLLDQGIRGYAFKIASVTTNAKRMSWYEGTETFPAVDVSLSNNTSDVLTAQNYICADNSIVPSLCAGWPGCSNAQRLEGDYDDVNNPSLSAGLMVGLRLHSNTGSNPTGLVISEFRLVYNTADAP